MVSYNLQPTSDNTLVVDDNPSNNILKTHLQLHSLPHVDNQEGPKPILDGPCQILLGICWKQAPFPPILKG